MKKYILMSIFALFTASLCAQDVANDTTKKEKHIHPSMVDGPRRQPKYVIPLVASDTDVNEVFFFLREQPIDPNRFNLAKELMDDYSYNVQQIMHLSTTFITDDYRVRFLKKAFKQCVNQEDYSKCLQTLKEQAAISELKYFLQKKHIDFQSE